MFDSQMFSRFPLFNLYTLKISRGVLQDTVLGPILYNLYLADQPKPDPKFIIQYADDTACVRVSANAKKAVDYAQTLVTEMESYYNQWGLEINAKKSELIVFGRGQNKANHSIAAGGAKIEESTSVKYLGILFSKHMRWN